MFEMKVESQMIVKDRTLVAGIPNFDTLPDEVTADGKTFKVIGVSRGVKLPYISLEIEKTNIDLEGKIITD